jgi:hypothetical protein
MTGAGEGRVLFVHLQKTAGTVLRLRLARALGEAAIYPGSADCGDHLTFSTAELRRLLPARLAEVRVVFGHFPLCVREILPGPYRTATILREPVERTLSYLRHHRERTPEDRDRTLEEIYDDPLRFHGLAHNHMTKMLSLTVDEMTADMLTRVEYTAERLERAKAALCSVDVVGVQERLDDFCATAERVFGWRIGDEPRFANRSRPVEVSPALRDRIALDNRADQELYEFAVQLIDGRRAATR